MSLARQIVSLGLVAALVLIMLGWAAWTLDPFHRRQRAERRAEQNAEAASAAALAGEGARTAIARLDVAVRQRDAARTATATLAAAAHRSEDSHVPLAPDRARRLLEHDRELCRIDPTLSGCAPEN